MTSYCDIFVLPSEQQWGSCAQSGALLPELGSSQGQLRPPRRGETPAAGSEHLISEAHSGAHQQCDLSSALTLPGPRPLAPGLKNSTVRSVAAASHHLYHRLGSKPRVFGAHSLPFWGRLHHRGAAAAAGGSTAAQRRTACDSSEPPSPSLRLTNAVVSLSIRKRPVLARTKDPLSPGPPAGRPAPPLFHAFGLSGTAGPKPGTVQAPPACVWQAEVCNFGHLCSGLWAQSSARALQGTRAPGEVACHPP